MLGCQKRIEKEMIYFTADSHFGHANIIKHCKRPFDNVDEMDEEILRRWNKVLKPGDRLFILGDFCGQKRKAHVIQSYLDRIKLHPEAITLILGNHDEESESRKVFKHVHKMYTLKKLGCCLGIVLCHYSMRVWDRCHHGMWHLFGHSHGNALPWGWSFDVGVDANDFELWSLDGIELKMSMLRPVVIDHHV